MINWARVVDLRNEVGEDAFQEVLDLFLEEMHDAMARLAAGPDPAHLGDELHFVRGAALNLGLREVCVLCQRMEHASKGTSEVEVAPLLECYNRSRQALLDGQPASESTA